nr:MULTISPECIES: cation:proton antiporter [Lactobacillus]
MNLEIFISTIILLVAAALAISLQNQFFKTVSVNYISLILGLILAIIPITDQYVEHFNSEVFMIMIVAPLLFFEGQQTSLHNVLRSWKAIVDLTVIMITLATVIAGFSLKFLLAFSLPLSFILAAISTPTDATAMASVTHGLKLPKRVAYFLKNESLFNDASGIILLNMATSWYISKNLNLGNTLSSFLISALGGIIFGFISGTITVFIRQKIIRVNFNYTSNGNVAIQLFYLLTPIVFYFLAEELKVSGIIAVVVMGLIYNAEAQRSQLINAKIIYDSKIITNWLTDILNGIVFIILGIIIVRTVKEDIPNIQTLEALAAGVILYLVNVLVRYVYTAYLGKKRVHINRKEAWIFAFGGVHGAVTFALAYTLAEASINPADFHLILVSETVLILLSMIVPTILFKFMLTPAKADRDQETEIKRIRSEMVAYALKQLDQIYLPKRLRKQLNFDLHAQINETSMRDFLREMKYTVKQRNLSPDELEFRDEVYRYAFRQERNYLGQIAQQENEYRAVFRKLYREILTAEILFLNADNRD